MLRRFVVSVFALLSLGLIVHANDLSTPEKAFEGFSALWKTNATEEDYWETTRREAEAASDACRTEELKAKKDAAREKAKKMATQTKIVWGDFEIEKSVPGESESLLIVKCDCTVRTPTFAGDDSYKESKVKEPYRVHYTKVGDKWLVKELYKVCWKCGGLTSCPRCQGTGRLQYGVCDDCRGGKLCTLCKGKTMIQANLDHTLFTNLGQLFVPDGDYTPSTDRSTAKAAVKAYMDSWIAREVVTTKRITAYFDRELPKLHAFVTAQNADVAKRVLEIALDGGRKRWKSLKHEIQSCEEQGDAAFAKCVATVDGVEYPCGLLLKKVDDKWLVAAELGKPCVLCNSKGICLACKGTGTMFEMKCGLCEGKTRCSTCKGAGMLESD